MTNEELDVRAKAWQAAANVLNSLPIYVQDVPMMLKALTNAVAEGYRQQKTPPTAG